MSPWPDVAGALRFIREPAAERPPAPVFRFAMLFSVDVAAPRSRRVVGKQQEPDRRRVGHVAPDMGVRAPDPYDVDPASGEAPHVRRTGRETTSPAERGVSGG
jgi:hypothetical protein